MTEIPDDVMKAAKTVWRSAWNGPIGKEVEVIARAILAERERCAKIAETMPTTGFPACYWMLENRAAAIRNNS